MLSEFSGFSRVLNGALAVSPWSLKDLQAALDQALELDPAHAPSTRLRGRLLPLLGEALCPRKIRASFRPGE